jgi:protein-tyrosine phosphatase
VIDLHAHVLPGLDDGPATVEQALALASAAVAAGTRTIVATPHVDHTYDTTPEDVEYGVSHMRDAVAAARVELEILPGAEVALTRLPDLEPRVLDRLRLGDGAYLLVECPHTALVPNLDADLFAVKVHGHQVILAHPERSQCFLGDPERLRRVVHSGTLCAVTAGSVEGRFGRRVREFALELLAEDLVHALVSDAHDTDRRPPGLWGGVVAAEKELPRFARQADWLVRDAPEAILAGRQLPRRPPGARGRRRRRRWWRRS